MKCHPSLYRQFSGVAGAMILLGALATSGASGQIAKDSLIEAIETLRPAGAEVVEIRQGRLADQPCLLVTYADAEGTETHVALPTGDEPATALESFDTVSETTVERLGTKVIGTQVPDGEYGGVLWVRRSDGVVGSGALIAKDVVLTASHVVDNMSGVSAWVEGKDGNSVVATASVNGWDRIDPFTGSTDVAVLYLSDWYTGWPDIHPLVRVNDALAVGDSITAVGYGGSELNCSGSLGIKRQGTGSVTELSGGMIKSTPLTCGGDSGGSLFKLYPDGIERIIGIHQAIAYVANPDGSIKEVVASYGVDARAHRSQVNKWMSNACEDGSRDTYGLDCEYAARLYNPDYVDRAYPTNSEGGSCADTNTWFNYSSCGDWKEFRVNTGSWVGLYAYGDSCGGCVIWHIDFDIEAYYDGWGWYGLETHNPEPDARGMIYTTTFKAPTNKFRIRARGNRFYVRVYDLGVENGGFETGSAAPGWLVSSAQPFPSITSNNTYVANRGEYSLGNTGSGTYSSNNGMLWGYGKNIEDFKITASSRLYFDTYGATYSNYAHHHVKVWWSTGGTHTYDNYVCCYSTGVKSGWSQQVFDFPVGDEGKTINKIEISFHKDHSGIPRYKPTIYLDNITLR